MASVECIDDAVLVRAAQKGNHQAFEELVRLHDRTILRLALRLTGSESDAQDIYQESFLRAYAKLGRFRFGSSFSTWIYRIATNLCMDHLRRKRLRNEDDLTVVTPEGETYDRLGTLSASRSSQPDTALASRELNFRINSALRRLTPRERVVFELKHYHGLRLRAIGAIVSVSEGGVKTSLFRATRKMRTGLADLR